jgi:flap endonuclease-1
MGIRNLNQYLRDNCPNSIKCINVSELSGKKIVVDISIYLYKYEGENALLENMYSMLSIFMYYNIIPVFIFDGKPPPEKKSLLTKRRECRELAQEEYNKLKLQLDTATDAIDDAERQHILTSMEQLKKQTVQLNKEKIENVKALIRAFGASYYDAPGEADELCALLVIRKKVWACLSEDMDLFVYGCSRVLRYFSLISHTVVLYHSKGIYNELNMTHKEFQEVCVLSGTDYNNNNTNVSLSESISYFKRFKKVVQSNPSLFEYTQVKFYCWLETNSKFTIDVELLNIILQMFNTDQNREQHMLDNMMIECGPVRQDEIKRIMQEEDFIFCK